MTLNPVQVRVLGGLIEKEIATPEGYPLSLNALVNACNQKSSRDPVMDLDEQTVREALHSLEELELVSVARDLRVPKFEHRARTVFSLRRDETAILCLLMLRGPQTPGELRSRSDRLYAFDDLDSVENTLHRLATRSPESAHPSASSEPLVLLLPRQAGSREARWMHLLSGASAPGELMSSTASGRSTQQSSSAGVDARVTALEDEVASLRARIATLEQTLQTLVQQSETEPRDEDAGTAS